MSRLSKLGFTVVMVIATTTLAVRQGMTAAMTDEKPASKAGDKAVASKAPATKGGAVVWSADQAKWADFPGLPGVHDAVVTGDPDKGASVLYLKIDPSAAIPWHWHSGPEIIYGDSGTFQAAMFKSDKTVNITSGSFVRLPGHMIHKASCISKEPCLLYLESPMKFDFHPVDENGRSVAPRKKS